MKIMDITFKENSKLRYFRVLFDGLQGKEPIFSDFIEAGLKANAVSVLAETNMF